VTQFPLGGKKGGVGGAGVVGEVHIFGEQDEFVILHSELKTYGPMGLANYRSHVEIDNKYKFDKLIFGITGSLLLLVRIS